MKQPNKDKFSYDEAINEVEKIVAKLEGQDGQCNFDDMISEVNKAMELLKLCKTKIAETEKQLDQMGK